MNIKYYCFTIPGINKYVVEIVNEDAYGTAENSAWVIDGATDVHGKVEKGTVQKFINALNIAMTSKTEDISFSDRLQYGIAEADNAVALGNLSECEAPTFAVCGVQIVNNTARIFLLGDSFAIMWHKGEQPFVLNDTRIEPFKKANRERINKITKDDDITPKDIYRKTRELANKPGGYPIGSTDPKSVKNGIIMSEHINKGDKLLLSTDGLIGYMESNELNIADLMSQEHIDAALEQALKFYDKQGKGRDDITAVLICIT